MGDFFKMLREKGSFKKVLILVLAGAVLIFISAISVGDGDNGSEISLDEYKERLEDELAALCRAVDGVGKCRVFVTFERGAQSTYKGNVLLETKPPKVMGVTVICRGGDSDLVRRELTDMLGALFGIGSNRISVLKLN